MNTTSPYLFALLIAVTGIAAQAAGTSPDAAPATTARADSGNMQASPGVLSGAITETMNSGGYTYVLIDTGSGKVWAAAGETAVTVGQRVSVRAGAPMTGFTSRTLNRTFDEIYFVDGIYPEDSLDRSIDRGHDTAGQSRTMVSDAHVEGVSKAPGGYTVEEIIARSAELSGQQVRVHGRVVRYTPAVMGTNWIHIQDGTPGDLAVTTDATVAKGDLVTVEGVLSTNRDFGAGYIYPAIIEKAGVNQ